MDTQIFGSMSAIDGTGGARPVSAPHSSTVGSDTSGSSLGTSQSTALTTASVAQAASRKSDYMVIWEPAVGWMR